MGLIARRLLAIAPEEATFARRGFVARTSQVRERLERAAQTFLTGYHAALAVGDLDPLAWRLRTVEAEWRGFAFEGAGMALALLDHVAPWRRDRVRRFVSGPGEPHAYMVHVGAGWALARLRRRPDAMLRRLDPLLGWLTVDGYGFHEGFFHGDRTIQAHAVPSAVTGYARRAFDQGLGRSLWFACGADVARIGATVAAFATGRRGDLWSGVGLACAYAGGADRAEIERLAEVARAYRTNLAQGVAFAAKARARAGNPVAHTALACEVLCGVDAAAAAAATDRALPAAVADGPEPAYEVWRRRIGRAIEIAAVRA